jgi:hypothetical protein
LLMLVRFAVGQVEVGQVDEGCRSWSDLLIQLARLVRLVRITVGQDHSWSG